MYTFIIIIHVIASIFLIAVILLQAGRGGGLADTFGGSQLQSLFGTKSTTILTRLTTICAIMFIVTCLSLALISSYRAKSLVEKVSIPTPVETVPGESTDIDVGAEEEVPLSPSEEETQAQPDLDEAGDVEERPELIPNQIPEGGNETEAE